MAWGWPGVNTTTWTSRTREPTMHSVGWETVGPQSATAVVRRRSESRPAPGSIRVNTRACGAAPPATWVLPAAGDPPQPFEYTPAGTDGSELTTTANARGAGTRNPRNASKTWPALRRRSAPLLDRHSAEHGMPVAGCKHEHLEVPHARAHHAFSGPGNGRTAEHEPKPARQRGPAGSRRRAYLRPVHS
jgi:hypothetical protein